MDWSFRDPPGTINPLRLAVGVAEPFYVFPTVPDDSDTQNLEPTTLVDTPIPRSLEKQAIHPQVCARRGSIPQGVPRLRRISTDCEEGDDWNEATWREFQAFHGKGKDGTNRGRQRMKAISHQAFFRSQTEGPAITVAVDPANSTSCQVLIEEGTSQTIYDAYLLRVDIMQNMNDFCRQQVVYDKSSGMYRATVRRGRVGTLYGSRLEKLESTNVKDVTNKFRSTFKKDTLFQWQRRYPNSRSPLRNFYSFVELDYRSPSREPQKTAFPNYGTTEQQIPEEVRDLMELMLYGGPQGGRGEAAGQASATGWDPFTAPYGSLSPWTFFSAFRTLQAIWGHLNSGKPIRWRFLLRASTRYRSLIPCCCGTDRPPVISNYHTLYLELRFLRSLWPRGEVDTMLIDAYSHGCLQMTTYRSLAQPLYQAYSSLRHGFRRLGNINSTEYRELRSYLEGSCHSTHNLQIKLKEIYSVFVKTGAPNPYRDWIDSNPSRNVNSLDRLLLWHGTSLDSVMGILDVGLQVRRKGARFTGTMYGNAIYLADTSSKSAGFCKHTNFKDSDSVLLLCEADAGEDRMLNYISNANGHQDAKSLGVRCIQGMGRSSPASWKRADWEMPGEPKQGTVWLPDVNCSYIPSLMPASLGFNEYVMYDPAHVTIRYLFRVSITGRRFF